MSEPCDARVLIVDDDPTNRSLLTLLLGKAGVTSVREESEGAAVADAVRSFDPHLVLLDVHLGAVDGLAALEELAESDPGFDQRAVWLLTGDSDPGVKKRAMELRARGVLTKPYDMVELRATIDGVLHTGRDEIEPMRSSPARPDFESLFAAAPGCFLVLDPDLVITAVSDAYLAATMTRRDDIVGRGLFEVFPDNPDDVTADGESQLQASLDQVRRHRVADTMAVQKYDIRKPASEGGGFEVRYWSPVNSPVLGAGGELVSIIHRVEDVTEFVQLQQVEANQERQTAELRDRTLRMEAEIVRRSQQLQDANRQLQAANDARSEFLSRVSHELRTPLTAILGFGELLSMAELGDEKDSWVTTLLSAGHHLLGLLNDVLDIARIDSGDVSLSLEPVSIDAVVAETIELMRPLASSRGVRLENALGEVARVYVQADRQRLRQVVINLVSNAIKYNRPDGVATIGAADLTDEHVRLTVSDTGAGLDEDQLARLFVAFERLSAAEQGIEGTGLGLVLSRHLAEAMGGSLQIASTPTIGTTVSVHLRVVEPVAVADAEATRNTVTDTRVYGAAKRVLYVEDMAANIRLVEAILKRRPSVTLTPVMAGGTALELARRHRPDLVLLDLHLPDISGEEVLRRLRSDETTRDVPVVILSADATSRQLKRLSDAGATTYLTKPIAIHRFLETLDNVLDPTS